MSRFNSLPDNRSRASIHARRRRAATMALGPKFSFPLRSELDMQYDDSLSDELVDGDWTNLKASI